MTLAAPGPSVGFASQDNRESQDAIRDLCARLATTWQPGTACAGFLQEAESRYYLYLESGDVSPPARDSFITLAEVLSRRNSDQLNRRERYRIALDLASSFVQLKSSPRMTAALRKTMIEFSHHVGPGESPSKLGPPLIARGFEASTLGAQPTGVDKDAIAALGITLSELCFGRPIEEYHDESLKAALGNSYSEKLAAVLDLWAARDCCGDVQAEGGPQYADAVEWCPWGVHKSASGASWRKEMLQNVVAPLEQCYKYLTRGVIQE